MVTIDRENLQGNLPRGIFQHEIVQNYIKEGHNGGWLFSPHRTNKLDERLILVAYSSDKEYNIILTPLEVAKFIVSPGGRYALDRISTITNKKEITDQLESALIEFKAVQVKILDLKR